MLKISVHPVELRFKFFFNFLHNFPWLCHIGFIILGQPVSQVLVDSESPVVDLIGL
jgi:hypothetical protein